MIRSASFIVLVLLFAMPQTAAVAQSETFLIDQAILLLDSDWKIIRTNAVEFLSKKLNPQKISPALKQRLKVEKDFHVKLILNYALASQGERSAIKPLIDSLSQTGHLGYVYLRNVTGEDFNWNQNHYQYWYDHTSDEEFKRLIDDRWRRKPMMDEYAEFVSMYSHDHFVSTVLLELNDEGELVKAKDQSTLSRGRPLTKAQKKRFESLPTTKSWRLFMKALTELDENGNRPEAAKLFGELVSKYPNTYYAEQAKDLADQLEIMIREDREFKAPADFEKLTLKEKIEFHIHHLRDVQAVQISQPGSCAIWFYGSSNPKDEEYNAAVALAEIGKPAIAYLVDLDEDRRPIRGVGYWRDFVPQRHVLRYSDASEQICSRIEAKRD